MALLLAAACSGAHDAQKSSNPFEDFATLTPKVGDLAPAFELRDADGRTVRLTDAVARGPVVLVFGSFS